MSQFFNLNLRDLAKGAVVAIISALVTTIIPVVDSGSLPTFEQLKAAGWIALTAGVSYLLKNLFTNSDDAFMKGEPVAPEDHK
jgi:hypothetical protein